VRQLFDSRNATVGGDVVAMCLMEQYLRPIADFKWRRGDDIITSSDKYRIDYGLFQNGQGQDGQSTAARTSTLTIVSVEEADEGTYTCFVMGVPNTSADVEITVTGMIIVREMHDCLC